MEAVDKWAFIDESGNDGLNLDKDSVSSHYVITGLLIDDYHYEEAKSHFEEVLARNFQGNAEMKSAKVKDERKRRKIIEELVTTDFTLYILVIDKAKLTSTGFRFPKSFVKYLHNILYKNIMHDFHNVHLISDRIKRKSFMEEFIQYLGNQYQATLWDIWDFDFIDSKTNPCVQAADFIGGTVARGYEKKAGPEQHEEYMKIIESRLGYFWLFPDTYKSYKYEGKEATSDSEDIIIENKAYSEAYRFLKENEDSKNPKVKEQVRCLQTIISYSYLWSSDGWIQTYELKERLSKELGETIKDQKLRGIIGGLRDAGVLIASRHAGGYKLPTSKTDIYEFVNTQNSIIGPMIYRVRTAREIVQRATDLDILDKPPYTNLKSAIEATPKWRIENLDDAE